MLLTHSLLVETHFISGMCVLCVCVVFFLTWFGIQDEFFRNTVVILQFLLDIVMTPQHITAPQGETLADIRHSARITYSPYGAITHTSDHDYTVVFI